MTKEVQTLLKTCDTAFRSGDRTRYSTARTNLKWCIKEELEEKYYMVCQRHIGGLRWPLQSFKNHKAQLSPRSLACCLLAGTTGLSKQGPTVSFQVPSPLLTKPLHAIKPSINWHYGSLHRCLELLMFYWMIFFCVLAVFPSCVFFKNFYLKSGAPHRSSSPISLYSWNTMRIKAFWFWLWSTWLCFT